MNQPRLNSSIHCLYFMMVEPCLDRQKYGIQVQWIWREVDKLCSCMGGVILMVTMGHGQGIYLPHSCSTICLTSSWWIAQLSKMMALWGPGQGVSLGAYINQNPKWSSALGEVEETFFCDWSFKDVQCNDSINTQGREYWKSLSLNKTQPQAAYTFCSWFVQSSMLNSSNQMHVCIGTSLYSATQVAHTNSSLSSASHATFLWVNTSLLTAQQMVAIETLQSCALSSLCCISSMYRVGFASRMDEI